MIRRGWMRDVLGVVLPGKRRVQTTYTGTRGQVTHVIILDGTMSTLMPGCESNAGLACKLLSEVSDAHLSVYYEAGIQWQDWRAPGDVIMGRGLNRQIRRAYGYLASRYREGDRIFLLGFSRGAYAVRSLAGVIDRVGLLRSEAATQRHVVLAYRHYRDGGESEAAQAFSQAHCHEQTEIEMIGVWDTVKALGLRLPLLWRLSENNHSFHSDALGSSVQYGAHALALHETRDVYAPVLWRETDGHPAHVEQVWFRGCHGDIGGQLHGYDPARPLANIPFCWIMEQMEQRGVALPDGWRARFPQDAHAPSTGTWRRWGKLFLARKRRVPLQDGSERLHPSVDAPKKNPDASGTIAPGSGVGGKAPAQGNQY